MRHLEASGRHLEASGGIWEASGRPGLPNRPQGDLRGLRLNKLIHLSAKIEIFEKSDHFTREGRRQHARSPQPAYKS